jgi:hypothetical protein
MQEVKNGLKFSLKLLTLEKDKARDDKLRAKMADFHIFAPRNELEASAIIIATQGNSGWKGSLYSLNYYDRYLAETCFIFATEPPEKNNGNWLLVAFNSSENTKYWIALGEKNLSEVYYSWAKVVQVPNPQFDPQRMLNESCRV